MEEAMVSAQVPQTTEQYRQALNVMLDGMDRMNARMEKNHADVSVLRAKSAQLKMETRKILAALGVAL